MVLLCLRVSSKRCQKQVYPYPQQKTNPAPGASLSWGWRQLVLGFAESGLAERGQRPSSTSATRGTATGDGLLLAKQALPSVVLMMKSRVHQDPKDGELCLSRPKPRFGQS